MAYIGRDIQYGTLDKQSFTANSSTTAFTLNSAVKDAKSLLVVVGGVVQEPEVAYTASATTLTFSEAPATNNVVYVIYLGKELSAGATRDNITYQTGTGNNSTTPLTLSAAPYDASAIMVMLNGVTQRPVTDYTVSGTTLTFTSPVATGVNILVYHLGSQSAIGTVTDNSVTDAKIVSMNAAKLTGSLPSGMGTDTTKIDQSIATLGLHIGVADNKVSYNLPSAFIDTFEGDDGILTETNVDRDATGEYVASATETVGNAAYVTGDRRSTITATSSLQDSGNGVVTNLLDGTNADNNTNGWLPYDNQAVAGKYIRFDYGANTANHKVIKEAKLYQAGAVNPHGDWKWQVSNDATTWTDIGSSFTLGGAAVNTLTELSGNTSAYRYYQVLGVSGIVNGAPGNTYSRMTEWEMKEASMTSTTNATGTLISKAQTADAAVSSSSGVMLYEDAEGTGTIGTDLKVYFSSNNGTNWNEAASYGSAQAFSGSTKMVKLGKTTISNTGTAVKMKAEWANQVAGSTGIVDKSSNGHNLTINGAVAASTAQKKYGTSSIHSNGSQNNAADIDVDTSNQWNFGTNNFTIEFWGRFNSTASIANIPVVRFKKGATAGNATYLWYFDHGVGLKLAIRMADDTWIDSNNGDINVGSTDTGNSGTDWTHFALVRNGNVWNHYRNGTSNWNKTDTRGMKDHIDGLCLIGKNSAWAMGGYFDDIRFSNTARYTANFTPPTAAFTSDANTLLLLNGEATTGKVQRLHGWAVNY